MCVASRSCLPCTAVSGQLAHRACDAFMCQSRRRPSLCLAGWTCAVIPVMFWVRLLHPSASTNPLILPIQTYYSNVQHLTFYICWVQGIKWWIKMWLCQSKKHCPWWWSAFYCYSFWQNSRGVFLCTDMPILFHTCRSWLYLDSLRNTLEITLPVR